MSNKLIFLILVNPDDPLPEILALVAQVAVFPNLQRAAKDGRRPDVVVIDGFYGDGPEMVSQSLEAFSNVPVVGQSGSYATVREFVRAGAKLALYKGHVHPQDEIRLILEAAN